MSSIILVMVMGRHKGFTLVETMIVVLIVSILSAVAIPILQGRIDSAKWTEGRTMAASIGTAIRTWSLNVTETGPWTEKTLKAIGDLGFAPGDLTGVYFKEMHFSWFVTYNNNTNVLSYIIKVTKPDGIGSPDTQILDSAGVWSE